MITSDQNLRVNHYCTHTLGAKRFQEPFHDQVNNILEDLAARINSILGIQHRPFKNGGDHVGVLRLPPAPFLQLPRDLNIVADRLRRTHTLPVPRGKESGGDCGRLNCHNYTIKNAPKIVLGP